MLWLAIANGAGATITVATYNVENYLVADRMVDGVYRRAYPKPEDAKTALRQVIRAMAPDLLALEEMGTRPFLEELQQDLKRDGAVYPYAEILAAADLDRHVALLSKFPLKEIRRHAWVPLAAPGPAEVIKRGVLEVTLATSGGDLTLFIVHLKSRRTEDRADPAGSNRRQREAEAFHDLVVGRFRVPADARFLVCGDWNDEPESTAVGRLVGRGNTVLGEILEAADRQGEPWTYLFRRDRIRSRIDYILVSGALKPAVVGGTAHVYDGPESGLASDHRPVWVELDLEPAR